MAYVLFEESADDLNARVLPYTGDHAYELFGLPHHHPDPFDRQIIAQALVEDVPVVTCDEHFRLYNLNPAHCDRLKRWKAAIDEPSTHVSRSEEFLTLC